MTTAVTKEGLAFEVVSTPTAELVNGRIHTLGYSRSRYRAEVIADRKLYILHRTGDGVFIYPTKPGGDEIYTTRVIIRPEHVPHFHKNKQMWVDSIYDHPSFR